MFVGNVLYEVRMITMAIQDGPPKQKIHGRKIFNLALYICPSKNCARFSVVRLGCMRDLFSEFQRTCTEVDSSILANVRVIVIALKGIITMNKMARLGFRMREIRDDLYGEDGLQNLACAVGVPEQTWLNYERGVSMPADLLLEFLVLTNANPDWLLTGEGECFKSVIDPFRSKDGRESGLVENR